MKLISDAVWGVSKTHLKILEAAEKLSLNGEWTSEDALKHKSNIRANFSEYLRDLVTMKFITSKARCFKLSISGLDCLAINSLRKRGLNAMGSNIAIGKESDIYYGIYNGKKSAIKINRLGRTSFQKVHSREFKNDTNWFEMNKENCRKEVQFLKLFQDFDVPVLFDHERHVIVMELLDYDTLYKIKVDNPEVISKKMIEFIRAFWEIGYVHGDFNEFNVMVNGDDIKILDFPQCIKKDHPLALEYLKRDIECVIKHFWKRNFFIVDDSELRGIYDDTGLNIKIDRKLEELAINLEIINK